jgi:hypothetical protein
MKKTLSAIPLLAFVLVLAPQSADAQQRGQEMMRQQERIQQLDQLVQRMDRIQDRIRQMDHAMIQEMDRLRAQQAAGDRLRQHERLREMNDGLGRMAQQMRSTLMQARQMEGDPMVQRDQVMQREMERLRLHLEGMCDGMEEGLRIMEQLHQRAREGGGPTR